jgi:hypothetical protein
MLDDDTLKGMYSERGVPTEWEELTPDPRAPANRKCNRARPRPNTTYVDATAYAEWLIHDPVAALRDSGLIPVDEESAEEPRVSTMVVNHEKTLNRFIMYALVLVSTNPKTVGLTIVKEGAPEL